MAMLGMVNRQKCTLSSVFPGIKYSEAEEIIVYFTVSDKFTNTLMPNTIDAGC